MAQNSPFPKKFHSLLITSDFPPFILRFIWEKGLSAGILQNLHGTWNFPEVESMLSNPKPSKTLDSKH